MVLANVNDVQASLMRKLTAEELELLDALLSRAENRLKAALGDARWNSMSEAFKALVTEVEANMVARAFLNPEGLKKESDGQYSYEIDRSRALGYIALTDEDLELLGLKPNGFTVANQKHTPLEKILEEGTQWVCSRVGPRYL